MYPEIVLYHFQTAESISSWIDKERTCLNEADSLLSIDHWPTPRPRVLSRSVSLHLTFTCRWASTPIETSAVACGHQRQDIKHAHFALADHNAFFLPRKQQQAIPSVFQPSKHTLNATIKLNPSQALPYQHKMGMDADRHSCEAPR